MFSRYQRLFSSALLAIMTMASSMSSQSRGAVVSLTVFDLGGSNEPLPAVNVRLLDAELREIKGKSGPTDARGVFRATDVPFPQTITIEYRLVGYVKYPERVVVVIDTSEKSVSGSLVSKSNNTDAYLMRVGPTIERLANATPNRDAKRAIYESEWEKIAELPFASQQTVARRISGFQFLAAVPTFAAALNIATAEGELVSVDAKNHTLIIKTAVAELVVRYSEDTKVTAAGPPRSGLATMSGTRAVIRFFVDGSNRIATWIEITER